MIGSKANPITDAFNSEGISLVQDIKAGCFGSLRPVILSGGSGPIFSAGIDLLDVMRQPTPAASRQRLTSLLHGFGALTLQVMSLPVPTVAAVNGHAMAGGAVLASAADQMIGLDSARAKFGAVESKVGIAFPGFARLAILRHLPNELVTDALLYGREFSHAEAHARRWMHALADSAEQQVEQAAQMVSRLDSACWPAYGATKLMHLQATLEYCREHDERLVEESMDIVFRPEGYSHLQAYVKAITSKQKSN